MILPHRTVGPWMGQKPSNWPISAYRFHSVQVLCYSPILILILTLILMLTNIPPNRFHSVQVLWYCHTRFLTEIVQPEQKVKGGQNLSLSRVNILFWTGGEILTQNLSLREARVLLLKKLEHIIIAVRSLVLQPQWHLILYLKPNVSFCCFQIL